MPSILLPPGSRVRVRVPYPEKHWTANGPLAGLTGIVTEPPACFQGDGSVTTWVDFSGSYDLLTGPTPFKPEELELI